MSAATINNVTGAIERYTQFTISEPTESAEVLRARFDRDSYLFFRGLVPADVVLEVRRDVLELCRAAGWLDPDRDLMDAIVGPGVTPTAEGKPDYMVMYRQLLRLPSFRAFPSQPVLLDMARMLLDGEVLVHPRRIGRVTFPNNTVATVPPHQDYYYIRGAADTYTAWIPLGACPQQLGGLAVWPGSHHKGFIDHTQHVPGAIGGCGIAVDGIEIDWHTIDFEIGDVLLFHSHSVHKALPNLSGNQIRISTDNRYQRADDTIDPSSLKQHFGFDDDSA
jgi:ectoine hydroxylase-related dioxygenase (phytanoyl-CoA dioxygenase family)